MRHALIVGLFTASLPVAAHAQTAEICGNTADEDADNLADDGCWPQGVPDVGVCDQPVSCAEAGAISPKKGNLVYHVLPDLTPGVAFGPSITLGRMYMSEYAPTYNFPSATDYKAPLGYRWMHSFMGWVKRTGSGTTGDPYKLVIHLHSGQDVMVRQDPNDGHFNDPTYVWYTKFQPGWRFKDVKQLKNSPRTVTVTTLAGERYDFDFTAGNTNAGKLIAIKDSLVTPNVVNITYVNNQVDRVTSANSAKDLRFFYFGSGTKVLQFVRYFVDGVQRVEVEYKYETTGNDKRKLTEVWIGGTKVESYTYDVGGYLTSVLDGGGKQVAAFRYWAGTPAAPGKAVSTDTPSGDAGWTYQTTKCDGTTGVSTKAYFNRANTTICSTDGECGTGNFCGGKTDTGATGMCFQAWRCFDYTSPNEDLITDVTGSSSSAVDALHYQWFTNSPTNDKIELQGVLSPDSVKTSFSYDANGMVKQRYENDTDYTASYPPPSGARGTYFSYDSTFPGKVIETRIHSELNTIAACDPFFVTGGCKRTLRTYNTDGLLSSLEEKGFTLDITNDNAVAYDLTTSYEYDTKGRLRFVRGPRTDVVDDTEYTYWTSGNGLNSEHINEIRRYKDATNYLATLHKEYDIWGAGTAQYIQHPDVNSRITCRTFDPKYGLLASQTYLVNQSPSTCVGQTGDKTSYAYDTHRRVTKITQPQLNCIHQAYDGEGRLASVAQGDYDGTSICYTTLIDTMEHTYSLDGRLIKTEWKDETGAITQRQEYTHYPDRRLKTLINPVNTAYAKTLLYASDGALSKLTEEGGGLETEWILDPLNRLDTLGRTPATGSKQTFDVTAAAILDVIVRVLDPLVDGKTHQMDIVYDDLNRKVKDAADEEGTNAFKYDEAGNLKTHLLARGSLDERAIIYSYDALNRRLTEDRMLNILDNDSCGSEAGPEVQYTYDALPVGVSCPVPSGCDNLSGRLAYVKTKMWCDTSKGDDTFDQETFYSYVQIGPARLDGEYFRDDSGAPSTNLVYTYWPNGNPYELIFPDGTRIQDQYDRPELGRSDANKIGFLQTADGGCCQTPLYNIFWYPFGPLKSYVQRTAFEHVGFFYPIVVAFNRNLAYRLTSLISHTGFQGDDDVALNIDYNEDVRGRYGKRYFTSTEGSNVKSMYIVYDDFSRVLCRRSTPGTTCPPGGDPGLAENLTYNQSNDRTQIVLKNALLAEQTYKYKFVEFSGTPVRRTDKIDCIHNEPGDPASADCTQNLNFKISFGYDARGNRLFDDDVLAFGASDDRRTYTYDQRNNLLSVTGKYWKTTNDMNNYVVANAYDQKNRRIFKSFRDLDVTCGMPAQPVEAQWFYYYDQFDRLVWAKHTPNVYCDSNTYSIYKWYWLKDRPIAYFQMDFPAATTTRRYLNSDDQGRPLQSWTWTDVTPTQLVWEVEPGLFGWDVPTVGASIFQPLRLPGQKYDAETEAVTMDGSGNRLVRRPGLADNRYRVYDSFTGTYIQADPALQKHWQAYSYEGNNPIGEGRETWPARLSHGTQPFASAPALSTTSGGRYSLPSPALPIDVPIGGTEDINCDQAVTYVWPDMRGRYECSDTVCPADGKLLFYYMDSYDDAVGPQALGGAYKPCEPGTTQFFCRFVMWSYLWMCDHTCDDAGWTCRGPAGSTTSANMAVPVNDNGRAIIVIPGRICGNIETCGGIQPPQPPGYY